MNNLLTQEPKKNSSIITEFEPESMLKYVEQYFNSDCEILSYPAKSYCVAIIYAHLISYYFYEDFYEVLSDPELLCLNDDYFVPYLKNKIFYDSALIKLNFSEGFNLNLNLPQIRSTFDYFVEEFSVQGSDYSNR